jgi:hypothetical protein
MIVSGGRQSKIQEGAGIHTTSDARIQPMLRTCAVSDKSFKQVIRPPRQRLFAR